MLLSIKVFNDIRLSKMHAKVPICDIYGSAVIPLNVSKTWRLHEVPSPSCSKWRKMMSEDSSPTTK